MTSVCFAGDFSASLDEGYKNVAHRLANVLDDQGWTVSKLNVKSPASRSFVNRVAARPRPDIVHIVSQPTSLSLLLLAVLRLRWRRTKFVLSGLQPGRYLAKRDGAPHTLHLELLRRARPDLLLLQSVPDARAARRLRITVQFLPNGVDTNQFAPVSDPQRRALRTRHGVDQDRPVVLHVGHLRPMRNLLALQPLVARGVQVLIVGSTYLGRNDAYVRALRSGGMTVIEGFQPNVHEFFQLADCYAFPVMPGDSLTMPLSILEAMAVNQRVVATSFPGIEHYFRNVGGLDVCSPDAVVTTVLTALAENKPVQTRQAVIGYSWDAIGYQLATYYRQL